MWVTAYARGEGQTVLRVDTPSVYLTPPEQANVSVEFDGETNANLQSDLLVNMLSYTISEGQLWKGGRPAPIAPPGLVASDLKLRQVVIDKLSAGTALTLDEVGVALRYLLSLPRGVTSA